MKPSLIKYEKLFNLGNFQHEKIGLEAILEEGDDRKACFAQLHQEVDQMHRLALGEPTRALKKGQRKIVESNMESEKNAVRDTNDK